MDLHVPHGPVRSFKDFLVHLGIVTLGILIALGLEQIIESHHRAVIAAEVVAGFRRELADNRQQVQEVMAAMPDQRAKIQAEIAALLAPPPADGSAAAPIKYPGINLDPISSASWDTAIATQALNELPYDAVKRYAEAYGVLRLFLDEERAGLSAWQQLHRFGEDRAALTPEQRRALIEELRGYDNFTQIIDGVGGVGKNALDACDRALKPG